MKGPRSRVSREQTLFRVMEALTSSLNLTEVLKRSYEVLSESLAADYAAICVSKPGSVTEYEWAVEAQVLKDFFGRYPHLANEDFVRRAVVNQPNKVLRDSEMLSRQELKRSTIYRYFQTKVPLEHVMAVLLDMRLDWHGGFTLYRERPHPFSQQEQDFLQRLTPTLASTVRNCRMLSEVSGRGQILEALFQHGRLQGVVLIPPDTEVMRTSMVTEWVRRWFASSECGRHGLPLVWLAKLEQLVRTQELVTLGQDVLEHRRGEQSLKVTFAPLPEQGWRQPWAVLLEEGWKVIPVPQEWRKLLTPSEVQVTEWLLQGVDNQYIAERLGRKLDTVKTHLKNIYLKVNVPSRSKLILLAQELNARAGILLS